MQLVITPKTKGRIEYGIIYGTLACIALLIARHFPLYSLLPSCAFKGVTGVPCPTCGATHALVHFSHGEFIASFAMNPLAAITLFVSIIALPVGLIRLFSPVPNVHFVLTEREHVLIRIAAGVVFLVHWGYLMLS
jgi:hypothetical protein